MSMDMFLKVDGIDGESQGDGHTNEIDVNSFSFGVAITGGMMTYTGGGGTAGKAEFQEVHIDKYVDKATPTLIQHCASGVHIANATITVRKASGANKIDFYIVKFTDLIISSFSNSGGVNDDRMSENITFNYQKIEFSYQPQDHQGNKAGGVVKGGWDVKANKPA